MPLVSKVRSLPLLIVISLFLGCNSDSGVAIFDNISIALDQEMALDSTKALNAGTQSLNRYHSDLRGLKKLSVEYNAKKERIDLKLANDNSDSRLEFHNIETRYLIPLLPYDHAPMLDEFDKANLLLAEYARNGINLSYHDSNDKIAFFNASEEVFNQDGEFVYTPEGEVKPNPGVKPKRMSVVNNCLNPGLWEINASDAVGEMYHGWFTLPDELYFTMVKDYNNIDNSIEELKNYINNPPSLDNISLDLDRFRKPGQLISTEAPMVAEDKSLGGYSTQDSRRKVQRGFYKIMRDNQQIAIESFGELESGDIFDMHSFIEPGIYNKNERTEVAYNPDWDKTEIYEVEPLTSYGGKHDKYGKYGYIEIHLQSSDQSKSIIAGNIPVQLLVFSEDYKIPAFGVGVMASSELVERRFLRFQEGTYPHYAYLAKQKNDELFLLNNHPVGYEQIYIRPFEKEQQLYLRFTVVSYERIVDLLEFNIPVNGKLAEKIRQASAEYKPPIYEVYSDTNII